MHFSLEGISRYKRKLESLRYFFAINRSKFMKSQPFKPEPIHWWILLGAIVVGIALFIAYRMQGY